MMMEASNNDEPRRDDRVGSRRELPSPIDLSKENFAKPETKPETKAGPVEKLPLKERLNALFSESPFREPPGDPEQVLRRGQVACGQVRGRGSGNKIFKFQVSTVLATSIRTFTRFVVSIASTPFEKLRSYFRKAEPSPVKEFKPPVISTTDAVRFTHESGFFVTPFRANPLIGVGKVFEKYGDCSVVIAPTGHKMFFIFDPEISRHVLGATDKKSKDLYEKSFLWRHGGGDLTGQDAVIFASGDAWKSRHEVMKSRFGRTLFECGQMSETIHCSLARSIEELKQRVVENNGSLTVDLSEEMALITLRAGLSALFSMKPLSREQGAELRLAFKELFESAPAECMVPTRVSLKELGAIVPMLRPLKESYQVLNKFADWIIDSRLETPGQYNDLLDLMLNVTDSETGEQLDRGLLRQEILTMASAVYETTSTLLSWAIPAAILSEGVHEKVVAEVDKDARIATGLSELEQQYPYLDQTVNETLRLYPSLWAAYRTARVDDEIDTPRGKLQIPAGSQVVLSPFFTHRRPEQWDKSGYPAEEFRPERWDKALNKELGIGADDMRIFSFGYGTRVCMGKHFARLEAISVLAHMFKSFEITPQFSMKDEDLVGHFSLQRKGGFPAVLSLRTAEEESGTPLAPVQ